MTDRSTRDKASSADDSSTTRARANRDDLPCYCPRVKPHRCPRHRNPAVAAPRTTTPESDLTTRARAVLAGLTQYLRDSARFLLSDDAEEHGLPRAEARGYAGAGLVEITSRRQSAKILRVRCTDLGREAARLLAEGGA